MCPSGCRPNDGRLGRDGPCAGFPRCHDFLHAARVRSPLVSIAVADRPFSASGDSDARRMNGLGRRQVLAEIIQVLEERIESVTEILLRCGSRLAYPEHTWNRWAHGAPELFFFPRNDCVRHGRKVEQMDRMSREECGRSTAQRSPRSSVPRFSCPLHGDIAQIARDPRIVSSDQSCEMFGANEEPHVARWLARHPHGRFPTSADHTPARVHVAPAHVSTKTRNVSLPYSVLRIRRSCPRRIVVVRVKVLLAESLGHAPLRDGS